MLGPSLDVKGGVSTVEKMMLKEKIGSFELEFLPTMSDKNLLTRCSHWIARLLSFPLRSVWKRPRIVHIQISHGISSFRKLILLFLWWMVGVKTVLHIHSIDTRVFPKLPFFIRPFVRLLYRRAHKFIVICDSWKTSYSSELKIKPERFHVIPNPQSHLQPIHVERKSGVFQFLFTGRIEEKKGAFELIEAFSKAFKGMEDEVRLVIAGDGDIKRGKEIATRLGAGELISFPGWVNEDKIDDLLTNSQGYVLPSHSEGLPMGILEAMAFGIPIIATPVGCIPDFVKHGQNGLVVPIKEPKELEKAMKTLVDDSELWTKIAKNVRKGSTELNLPVFLSRIEEVWGECVNLQRYF